MALRDRIAALLGVSAFAKPMDVNAGPSLDSDSVQKLRREWGGQIQPVPRSQTRWYLSDIESAELAADNGNLAGAAKLMRSARKDGVYSGVLSTRTGGLVRLPKRFRGNPEIIAALEQGHEETRSTFDEMFPATELALLAADGVELGVGVAELVEVEGRQHRLMVRLDPEFLYYRWSDNQWLYRSIAGMLPITPGDGRWILHMPGGRMSPWQHGLWRAIGRAYIRKEHASFYRDNWQAKLANSARVAVAPQAASQEQKESWFHSVMGWGVNTVFGMTPGYDVKLLESNGRGYESFRQTIADQNQEIIIAVAGQTVTTDGGAGFANADVHKSIRADLIKETADGLAHTINTQGLPIYIVEVFGDDALDSGVIVEWDVTPPKDRAAEATALTQAAGAMKALTDALAQHGLALDANAMAITFGVPVATEDSEENEETQASVEVSLAQALDLATQKGMQPTSATVISIADRLGVKLEQIDQKEAQPLDLSLAPTDAAKIIKASEGRRSMGLPPFGDARDEKTITEMGEKAEASAESEGDVAVVEAEADADSATQEQAV